MDSDDEGEGGVRGQQGHGRQLSSEQWIDPWSRQGAASKTKKKKKKKEVNSDFVLVATLVSSLLACIS